MPRGGRTKATWPKGQKPPVKKPKGAKNKRTLLKEAIGIDNWAQLQSFIETHGIKKCVQEIQKLSGKDFVSSFTQLTEFVKPKLARTEVLADVKTDITWQETKTYDDPNKKTKRGS